MSYLLYNISILCVLIKYTISIHDYGPVDLPDGVQLQLGYRDIDLFPTHRHFSSVFRNSKHNGGISSDIDDDTLMDSSSTSNEEIMDKRMDQDKWVDGIAPNIEAMSKLLNRIGLINPPNMNRCKKLQGELKIKCIEEEMKDIFLTSNEIVLLNMRVLFGGRFANKALTRLNTISCQPKNRQLLILLGTSTIIYFSLMRESFSDRTRWLAQSVLSKLTDLPVANNIADFATGGYGHVNILLPNARRVRSADRYIASLI